ncbi:LysR substrate-binding domain-containing protein [Paraburkholderia atlantica]|uniref:LysR substrate-binding domain-containing protein n=1 Tax=Paraburkholderia atlantica TaxID=2654982 RepID=UPI0021A973EE|nr:LysR substrate-binding domain-containing protein [Paraburkholderia atlantica]
MIGYSRKPLSKWRLRFSEAMRRAHRRINAIEKTVGGGAMSGLNIHSLTRRIDPFTLRLFLTVVEEQQIRRAALREIGVSSTSTIIVHFLAWEIARFMRDFPLVDIEFHEDANVNVVNAVVSGNADLAVFYATDDIDSAKLDIVAYRSDRLVAVVPRGHPLGERASVTTRDPLDEDLVGISPATSMMKQLRNAATALGRELRMKYCVNTMEAARALVKAELGVTIQPESMLSREDFDKVATVPLDEPWADRQICVGTKRGETLTAATRALVAQLTDR